MGESFGVRDFFRKGLVIKYYIFVIINSIKSLLVFILRKSLEKARKRVDKLVSYQVN